jgi:hypothetical protein
LSPTGERGAGSGERGAGTLDVLFSRAAYFFFSRGLALPFLLRVRCSTLDLSLWGREIFEGLSSFLFSLMSAVEGGEMEAAHDWRVVLFYQYCDISAPEVIYNEQLNLCKTLNLKGRIRISSEGINGTLQGSAGSIEEYIHMVDEHVVIGSRIKPIHWKFSGPVDRYALEKQLFKSLSVKVVKEVVSLDLQPNVNKEIIEGLHSEYLSRIKM